MILILIGSGLLILFALVVRHILHKKLLKHIKYVERVTVAVNEWIGWAVLSTVSPLDKNRAIMDRAGEGSDPGYTFNRFATAIVELFAYCGPKGLAACQTKSSWKFIERVDSVLDIAEYYGRNGLADILEIEKLLFPGENE